MKPIAIALLLAAACARPTPANPHPTQDAIREVVRELLGLAIETACTPEVADELRPTEAHPIARALFDASRKKLCPKPESPAVVEPPAVPPEPAPEVP